MKENYTYNQYKKKNVRHSAIYNAVELLTSKRESAACVERNYVRRLYDYFTLSEDISQNREDVSYRITCNNGNQRTLINP